MQESRAQWLQARRKGQEDAFGTTMPATAFMSSQGMEFIVSETNVTAPRVRHSVFLE